MIVTRMLSIKSCSEKLFEIHKYILRMEGVQLYSPNLVSFMT